MVILSGFPCHVFYEEQTHYLGVLCPMPQGVGYANIKEYQISAEEDDLAHLFEGPSANDLHVTQFPHYMIDYMNFSP